MPDYLPMRRSPSPRSPNSWRKRAGRRSRGAIAAASSRHSRHQPSRAAAEQLRLRLIEAAIAQRNPDRISETALAALRGDAANADAQARAARLALDATAEPVARLQSAAHDLLVHDHSGLTQCPVCAHNWGDLVALRAAIASTLAAAPAFTEFARIVADLASETASAARARLDAALSAHTAIEALEKERTALAAAVEQRKRDIARLGLASDDPLEAITAAEDRLNVADVLAELVAARDALTPTLPGGPAPLLPLETMVSGLLDHLARSFAAREQFVQLQLAEIAKAIETATTARDQLRASHASTSSACARTVRGCATRRPSSPYSARLGRLPPLIPNGRTARSPS